MSNISFDPGFVNITGMWFWAIQKSSAMCDHFAHRPGRLLCAFRSLVIFWFCQNCSFSTGIVRPSERSGNLEGCPQYCRNKVRYSLGCSTTARASIVLGSSTTGDSTGLTMTFFFCFVFVEVRQRLCFVFVEVRQRQQQH